MDDASDKRHFGVASILPDGWDRRPFSLATEIRAFLKSIADANTSIDSGGGDGTGDLWVTVQGVEYYVTVAKSKKQMIRESALPPPTTPL